MASVEARFEPFTRANLNIGGMIEVLKSGAVHAKLDAMAAEIAEGANDDAASWAYGEDREDLVADGSAYHTQSKDGKFVAMALVETATLLGRIDQAKNHTLDTYNHEAKK